MQLPDLDRDLPEYQEYIRLLGERFANDPSVSDPLLVGNREKRITELFKVLQKKET